MEFCFELKKVIGKEYAETGITCNAIAPAVVRTQMVADMPADQVKYMTDKIPMKRYNFCVCHNKKNIDELIFYKKKKTRTGEIEEIASLVSFIVSKDASFTTAFVWDATGGRASE